MRGFFLLFLSICVSVLAISQPGTLDSSFEKDGFALTKIPGSLETHFEQSTLQSDGKILAVGWAAIPANGKISYDFIVVRYNSNGTLDGSFGTQGIVTTDFNGKSDFAYTVAVQKDGKIVVGGRTQEVDGSALSVALVRYKANGTLDGAFGNKGKAVTTLSEDSEIKMLLIQNDGRIVAVGFTQDFLLIRYNPDGKLDSEFGKNGIVLTDFNGGYDVAVSAALQRDDKIVVVGNVGASIGLARYNSNGSLDKRFGNGGKIITTLGKDLPQLAAVAIQDNRIIVGGTVYKRATDQGDYDFLLVRYTATGLLDNTFGTGGIVYTDFGNNTDEAITSVAIQDNEKILVSGGVSSNRSSKIASFALARFNTNGWLDESFGASGVPGIVKSNLGSPSDDTFYDYSYSMHVSKNRLYCVGMNKLPTNDVNSSATQGIVVAYKIGNTNLSCTPSKTVATDKGMCSAVISDVGPVFKASSTTPTTIFSMTGATTLNGKGSVNGKTFNKGITTVTYKLANDPLQSCSFLVTVEDREAPVIINAAALPAVVLLTGKMQTVTVNYKLKDNCSAKALLSITSTEGSEADWRVIDTHHVQLKASRADQTFTIKITATDKAGNNSSKKLNITVSK